MNTGQVIVINASAQPGNAPVNPGPLPFAGTVFDFLIAAGTPQPSTVLVFTDPNGISHTVAPTAVASNPSIFLGVTDYLIYTALPFEFNKPGPWTVLVRTGALKVGPFPFMMGLPLAATIPRITPRTFSGVLGGTPIAPLFPFLTDDSGTNRLTDDAGLNLLTPG